jgi:hypothetical protein
MVAREPPREAEHEDRTTHAHRELVHGHDHYHVSHHHRDGMLLGEWEHRTSWHAHEHNHSALLHAHEYSVDDEEREHDHEAHLHDHAAPAESPN